MKYIFRIVGIGVLIFTLSGCAEMFTLVSNTMTQWQQSEQSTSEQKAIASIWNEGGTRGKIIVGTAALTDIMGTLGVNTSELRSIQEATQTAVANTKATGNEWYDVGLTIAYYGASIADNRISKKKDQEFDEYVQEHRDLYTDPENTAYYDEFYDYRYKIDYETRTITERSFNEVMAMIRSNEASTGLSTQRKELIAWGILSEYEYDELFGDGSQLLPIPVEFLDGLSEEERKSSIESWEEERQRLLPIYNGYLSELKSQIRKYHYVPGTYDSESNTYKKLEDYYAAEEEQKRGPVELQTDEGVSQGHENTNGIDDVASDDQGSQQIIAPSHTLNLSEIVENVHVTRFTFNTVSLSDDQKAELDELVELMKDNDVSICITGHTCSIGSDRANYNVGYKRAEEAKKYLVNKGIAEERIILTSAGASMPIASNDSAEGRCENRRISFAIQ